MHRHARQVRLAEVGEAGQARLAAATVDVPLEGAAGEIAARYLAGAGIGHLRVTDPRLVQAARAVDPSAVVETVPALAPLGSRLQPSGPPPELDLEGGATRDLALGALAALAALRDILGVERVS
jgi:hypothetical protein